MNSDNQPTCLFTGTPLGPTTREEHTIPRGLGGRIRSKQVSSDAFNQASGAYLDELLKSPYAQIMNVLAPLLSGEHQPGQLAVDVPGEPSGLVLDRGALTRRNLAVLTRDENGQPRSAVASDARPLRAIAQQLRRESTFEMSTVRASDATTFYRTAPVVLADIELAALKSALLTFDHLLQPSTARFTRHRALDDVRAFVRSVVETRRIDGNGCNRFSLGLQYDRLPLYRELRQQIGHPETPFEHVLFVSGSGPSRCVDLVWLVLGFDPFGFRLSHEWDGGDFAFGLSNGILRDTTASLAVPIAPLNGLLCHPTELRSFPDEPFTSESQNAVQQQISSMRMFAYQQAVYLTETTADDAVRANLIEAARVDAPMDRTLETQLKRKLRRIYGRRGSEQEFLNGLEQAFHHHGSAHQELLSSQIDDAERVDWPLALAIYRGCLDELRQTYGLPGDVFSNRTMFGMDNVDSRLLGQPPPPESASTSINDAR